MSVALLQCASVVLDSEPQSFMQGPPRLLQYPAWRDLLSAILPQECAGAGKHICCSACAGNQDLAQDENPCPSVGSRAGCGASLRGRCGSACRTRRGGGTSTAGGCRGTRRPSAATTPPSGAPATTRRARTTSRAPNIDHTQEFVRQDITKWLKLLRSIGFDGFRFDFVKGYSAPCEPARCCMTPLNACMKACLCACAVTGSACSPLPARMKSLLSKSLHTIMRDFAPGSSSCSSARSYSHHVTEAVEAILHASVCQVHGVLLTAEQPGGVQAVSL